MPATAPPNALTHSPKSPYTAPAITRPDAAPCQHSETQSSTSNPANLTLTIQTDNAHHDYRYNQDDRDAIWTRITNAIHEGNTIHILPDPPTQEHEVQIETMISFIATTKVKIKARTLHMAEQLAEALITEDQLTTENGLPTTIADYIVDTETMEIEPMQVRPTK